MKRAVKGLDHVVVMVDGIDAAEAAYKNLGFQVQPRGFHRKLGTANHLMIFDKDYFEILGIVEDTAFNAERREWLKQGGGLANVALATDGADIAFDAFKAAGLEPDAPLFFDRAVEVAGKTEHAQFRTVRIPKTHMPVVGFFVCEHLTPQFVYRSEWAQQAGNPAAYAPFITAPVIIQFARGDKTVPNPTASAIIRAGNLQSRSTLFRNDLAVAANPAVSHNPHTFLTNVSGPGAAFAFAAQQQIATFFASDGVTIIDPDGAGPFFETPTSMVPEDLAYLP